MIISEIRIPNSLCAHAYDNVKVQIARSMVITFLSAAMYGKYLCDFVGFEVPRWMNPGTCLPDFLYLARCICL